jgi:hypothetical protein
MCTTASRIRLYMPALSTMIDGKSEKTPIGKKDSKMNARLIKKTLLF